jgi:hypothetical protein
MIVITSRMQACMLESVSCSGSFLACSCIEIKDEQAKSMSSFLNVLSDTSSSPTHLNTPWCMHACHAGVSAVGWYMHEYEGLLHDLRLAAWL